jgi:nucleoid-associated protein YgaU
MFAKNSRYYAIETVEATSPAGETVQAVKLRRLPATSGQPLTVKDGDQLDVLSEQRYRDPTRFWNIADANTELEANTLVEKAGRVIQMPAR